MSRVTVLGAGGWGIGLAMVATRMEHTVTLWSFDEEELEELRRHNQNRLRLPGVFLPRGITLTGDMATAADADMIIWRCPPLPSAPPHRRWRRICAPTPSW